MSERRAMNLEWLAELPSTQDEAHRRAEAGAPHGTAVAAEVQTAGRGTRGREWASGLGGLWMSVVCRPAVCT
ncbi:MAG: biotin--[acetyl-CoA-carboxylase] ligase, partial [Gemmatimonadales bacterium]|nr:biotin--[acetyl-CoA-carboxylase] ligase [Gemmatimonadales bacterium]